MSKHDTPTETQEQLLIRRVFKLISDNHFNDHKLIAWYCGGVHFERGLGDDVANYVRKTNPDYYKSRERKSLASVYSIMCR